MKVNVTQEHIDAGVQSTPSSCPIALAVKEQLGVSSVHVYADYMSVDGRAYHLPNRAYQFIKRFDSRVKGGWLKRFFKWLYVRPFTFESKSY